MSAVLKESQVEKLNREARELVATLEEVRDELERSPRISTDKGLAAVINRALAKWGAA